MDPHRPTDNLRLKQDVLNARTDINIAHQLILDTYFRIFSICPYILIIMIHSQQGWWMHFLPVLKPSRCPNLSTDVKISAPLPPFAEKPNTRRSTLGAFVPITDGTFISLFLFVPFSSVVWGGTIQLSSVCILFTQLVCVEVCLCACSWICLYSENNTKKLSWVLSLFAIQKKHVCFLRPHLNESSCESGCT